MDLKQYQIVLVSLDPTWGSEMKKTRPYIIISPNEMNKYLQTIIIAPIISSAKTYPTRVPINQDKKNSWIVVDQIRTIDRQRIIKVLGDLNEIEIGKVKQVLRELFVD